MNGHLSSASSYKKVCLYYDCPRVLFTGSPVRLDGKPLDLADSMVIGISAKELIKQGKISDYNYYAPDLKIDLSKVNKVGGDYNNKELGEAVCGTRIYGDILKYYNMLAKDRQAIAYCVNVKHSEEICKMFNDNNIPSIHIDSHTPEEKREEILNDFKEGKFKILCNCNLISEGITLPTCEVCLMLRPTCSLALYIQQSMRALTPEEGKKAIIIDFSNNIQKFGFPTMEREWSLTKPLKEYYNENDNGTLKIRVCQHCFSTFETAPICPYCGAEYVTTQQEIENFKEIQLRKIEEIKEEKRQKYLKSLEEKVAKYGNAKECENWVELIQWCKFKRI